MKFNFELDNRLGASALALAALWLMLYVGGDVQHAAFLLIGVLAGRGLGPGVGGQV